MGSATLIDLPELSSPAKLTWTLMRNVASVESPLSNAVQRQVRTGDRWSVDITFPTLLGQDADALSAWLDQASRADRRVAVTPEHNILASGFTPAELVPTWYANGTAGWSAAGGVSAQVVNRRLYLSTSGTVSGGLSRSFTVTAAKPYMLLVDVHDQGYTGRVKATDGGGATLADVTVTGAGLVAAKITPASSPVTITLYAGNGSTAGRYAAFGNVSLAPCMDVQLVSGVMFARNLHSAAPAVSLQRGQFVAIYTTQSSGSGWELKRVAEDCITQGASQQAPLIIEPGLRGTVSSGSAIWVYRPRSAFLIAKNQSAIQIDAPRKVGVSVSFTEDLLP